METSEKQLPVRNLERIAEKTGFTTYSAADLARNTPRATGKVAKVKIFARSNGTYDVVWYAMAGAVEEAKPATKVEEPTEEQPKVHGLKAKDRRKRDKKQA